MVLRNIFIIALLILVHCKKETKDVPVRLEGNAFGTSFHITYFGDENENYLNEIDSLFELVNSSLSTYIPTSDISRINKGDTSVVVDHYFKEVYEKSKRIYQETNGVFDPTIGVLVNAWGFGPERVYKNPDSVQIERLLQLVNFDHIAIIDEKVSKKNDSVYFDFNAIAKGYAVDVAGRFLEEKEIHNYLVEIGGEIRSRGINIAKDTLWSIGIEDPNFDGSRSLHKVIYIQNEAIATSGNYRKFKVDSVTGQRYVHILNTKTGYPTISNLLSVSVIGKTDCADVDGYATALMAMPLEEAKEFLSNHSELKGFIIYNDEDNALKTYSTLDL